MELLEEQRLGDMMSENDIILMQCPFVTNTYLRFGNSY
jgi:hypothetical protein